MHRRQILKDAADDKKNSSSSSEETDEVEEDDDDDDDVSALTSDQLNSHFEVIPAQRLNEFEENQLAALNLFLKDNSNKKYEGEKLTRNFNEKGLVPWIGMDAKDRRALPPSDFTVTKIKHTHDLQMIEGMIASDAQKQSTAEWLQSHSIKAMHLNVEDLIEKGKVGRPKPDRASGKPQSLLEFRAADVLDHEYKVNVAIEMFTQRIKWCLQGSRRMFGLLQGSRIGLALDCSDANMGFGRHIAFQTALLHLLDEQVVMKSSSYWLSFGTEIRTLWPNSMDVSCRSLEEAKMFINGLGASGGCNLLRALKQIMSLRNIDMVMLVLGSVPDQDADKLLEYVRQLSIGRHLPIYCIAFDCSNYMTHNTLRELAEVSGGRYHCYSAVSEEQIYTSTDIAQIIEEIYRAQEVLKKIQDMRQGMLDSTLVSIMSEISAEIDKLPQSRFLPRPPGHDLPLNIENPKFIPTSSLDWLKDNGLKSRKLDLYQVLAPNAYSYREEFIPTIRKTVQSQVHERAMTQFDWHDGSVKNVHVDMAQLFEYQKQLGLLVKVFEQRVNWLASASRKIFGTIIERNIVLIIDTSVSNVNYLIHIQHSLRLLFEQQMINKEYFNLVAFDSEIRFFRKTLIKVTEENLQTAWKWVLNLECKGSRNLLGALREILENEEEAKHGILPQGLYLFTSGIPDQPTDLIASYVEEKQCAYQFRLHTVLFNVDDYDAEGPIPGRYANISKTSDSLRYLGHCSSGRFHWFRETGIIESDDIQVIMREVDRAVNFSRKAKLLVDSAKRKYEDKCKTLAGDHGLEDMLMLDATASRTRGILKALPPPPQPHVPQPPEVPRATTLSMTRQNLAKEIRENERNMLDPMESVGSSRAPFRKAVKSAFYTEERNHKGVIISNVSSGKSVRKKVGCADIPKKEDQVTSKVWMQRYRLSKLGLDLNRLISGPDCKHESKLVKPLHKMIEARYCSGLFPTVNVAGTIKHLQYTPLELINYDKEVKRALKRYLRRFQWLLSGSRATFGVVAESRCVFLVDVSGSMESNMQFLRESLKDLIWEQLYKHKVQFNLIAFSSTVSCWKQKLVDAEEAACHDAIVWIDSLNAHGNTATLEALEKAFEKHADAEAFYFLTDGKPDTSTTTVLRKVGQLCAARCGSDATSLQPLRIHTISFNCKDDTANSFLRCLAKETSARYHRVVNNFDATLFAHKLLNETDMTDPDYPQLPELEGDDLNRLGKEINASRLYLRQSQYFKDLYMQLRANQQGAGLQADPTSLKVTVN